MIEPNPIRTEIEQILTNHPRTRFAKVLIGMNRGLTDAEMAAQAQADREPIREDGVAAVRRIVELSLANELVNASSEAEEQANFYRELLNYKRTPELNQHIRTRLTRLQSVGPNVRFTPLGDVRLGANKAARSQHHEPPCPQCYEVHRGECY